MLGQKRWGQESRAAGRTAAGSSQQPPCQGPSAVSWNRLVLPCLERALHRHTAIKATMCPTTTRAGNTVPGGLAGIGPGQKWTVPVSEGRWGGVKGEEGWRRGGLGVCCHSRILVLQPKLSVTYKRASRLQQQPSPAARWPSPFSPCYSNNSECFSSSPLSRLHIELGPKKLCFFSFFAASTEFLRRGSCLSSQGQLVPPSNCRVASPQPLSQH